MDAKRCTRCQQEVAREQFRPNRHKPSGLDDMCGLCRKAYNVAYYQRTKDRHNPGRAARRKKMRDETVQRLIEYLSAHPCVDCGETDIVVLQFDHQRDKESDVAKLVRRGYAWDRVLAEIEKCQVVCANDHRRRTAKAFGWARLTAQASAASSTG